MQRLAYILEYPISSWVRYELEALGRIGIQPIVCPVNVLGEGHVANSFQTVRHAYLFSVVKNLLLARTGTLRLFSEWKDEIGKRMFLRALYVADAFRRRKIEHVHAHFAAGAGSFAYLVKKLSGIPYSLTVHAYDIFMERVNREKLCLKLTEAEKVRCISQYNQDFLLQRFPDLPTDKFEVIHCGVDINQYAPQRGNGSNHRTILSIGNFLEKKGFIDLLRACKSLKDKITGFRCVIVGEGEMRKELEDYLTANNLNDVVSLPGQYPNQAIYEVLKNSALFVLPCRLAKNGDRDGIPVTLMEAMASGVPVISTRVSGISELIEDRVSGRLVRPGNDGELADAIADTVLSPDLRRKYAEKGRETVVTHFNIDNIARELKGFFEGMPR